jgi:outer membrane protein assembly factor BamB
MSRQRFLITLAGCALVAAPLVAGAQMHGGNGGMMGGMAGGAGVLVVADDGSLLVTDMMGSTMMGGATFQRGLIRIGADGVESWRADFDDGYPMMPATDGDLVVLVLRDDWFMGAGGNGDGGWGPGGGGGGSHADQSIVVGLDLATGAERWRLELDGDMVMTPQFAPDGERLYLTVRDFTGDFGPGDGPMDQGDTLPASAMMATTVVALDRDGAELWRLDLGDDGMGGPMPSRRLP